MARERSSEEVRKHYIEGMGEELGSLFHALWNEVAWVYMKWDQYVELFGTKPSRIDLLNEAAGSFFKIVQDSLFEDTILHIARLTDPPKSAGKDNLTIQRLTCSMGDEEVSAKVAELVKVAIEKSGFCRDWRNRHIAHRDLKLALKEGAEPLKLASHAKVKEALKAISDVLNAASIHYMHAEIGFSAPIISLDGAVSLLYVLDDGLRAKKERLERLKTGKFRPDDHGPRDL